MVQPASGPVDQKRGANFENDAAELTDLRVHGCHSA
jgi:hypothetical protein